MFRENARDYYEKASNDEQLVKCYQMLEDYDTLEKMVTNLPDKHPLLVQIASVFSSVGMCSQAVSAFVKVSFVCVFMLETVLGNYVQTSTEHNGDRFL